MIYKRAYFRALRGAVATVAIALFLAASPKVALTDEPESDFLHVVAPLEDSETRPQIPLDGFDVTLVAMGADVTGLPQWTGSGGNAIELPFPRSTFCKNCYTKYNILYENKTVSGAGKVYIIGIVGNSVKIFIQGDITYTAGTVGYITTNGYVSPNLTGDMTLLAVLTQGSNKDMAYTVVRLY